MRLLFGFAFLIVQVTAFSQIQSSFYIGAKYQPADWQQINSSIENSFRDRTNYWPILEVDLSLRKDFDRKPWFVEAGISLRHARQVLRFDQLEIDPFYGFVYDTSYGKGDIIYSDRMYYVGLQIGGGYRILFKNRKQSIVFPLGLQYHIPIFSNAVSSFGKRPIYRGESFSYGVYYGAYFRPTYEFSLSQKASSPWRFSVYTELDVLIQHRSEINPKYLLGLGLAINYTIGK